MVIDADFGPAYAGLPVGVTQLSITGAITVARTTSVADCGNGYYLADVVLDPATVALKWDTGGVSPVYAHSTIDTSSAPSAAQNASAVRSELSTELGRIDTAVSSRMATFTYAAPDNAGITAIKAKTDNIPTSPATAAAVAAIPTNPLLTTDSRLNNLDASVSSRLAADGYTAPDNASISAILADTSVIGPTGGGLTSLASASSLATVAGYIDTEVAAIKAKTDNLPASPAAAGEYTSAIAAIPTDKTGYSLIPAYDPAKAAASQASVTALGSPMQASSYIAPDNTSVSAIKSKTDNLPTDPADHSLLIAAISSIPSAPSASTVAAQVRTELTSELSKLDATVSSRLASASYTAPDNASISSISSRIPTSLSGGKMDAVVDKTGYSLTGAERTAIATVVEQAILNDGDGQAILNAIVGAIGNLNIDQVALIAAIRADLERVGGSIKAIQGKTDNLPMSPASTSDIPTASTNASAVRSELSAELGRIDAAVSSRLPTSGYTAPDNTSVSAIKAKTDTLTNAPTASETATAVWEATTRTLTVTAGMTPAQEAKIDAVKAKTDNLPASPASSTDIPTAADIASDILNTVV